MNRLYTYISAINSNNSLVRIINKIEKVQKKLDDEGVIEECEIIYEFDNSVKILYKMESDSFESDQDCQECWISYKVLNNGEYYISPAKKHFYNKCQEAFWIKMQSRL